MSRKRIKVKPGKTQSQFGFVIGIVFVIIGCVVVIPIFGPFGILWTVVAGFIAFSHFKNGFSDEGMATHEIVIEDNDENYYESYKKNDADDGDVEEKLKKLESLYNQGLITREEYDGKRKELLEKF